MKSNTSGRVRSIFVHLVLIFLSFLCLFFFAAFLDPSGSVSFVILYTIIHKIPLTNDTDPDGSKKAAKKKAKEERRRR